MAKRTIDTKEELSTERTTGSVFAALGYGDPAAAENKSRLVTALNETIEARGLTQVQAAQIMKIDQPTLSKILRGRTRSFSTDRLAEMLNALGRNVTVVVERFEAVAAGEAWSRGSTTVEVVDAGRRKAIASI
jgi:predicted XRE-type DNA-binding protein